MIAPTPQSMLSQPAASQPIVRFAPSPTGYLHVGGARTALFNWLYAKRWGGLFYLRIEDTDRERSTQQAVDAIINGLQWLGLNHDGAIVFQFERAARHREVALQLVDNGQAYYCECSAQDIESMRETARLQNLPPRYNGKCRNKQLRPDASHPMTVRFKSPQEGIVHIDDLVQGPIDVQANQLDDLILLRSDGTPTYMLSVVVDDHDMGVTHIIRGDDHLTNAFRQQQIYQSCDWTIPHFAHIPLIHGPDGAKLSKRHGALAVEDYRDMGYLPNALLNYLLRLGWAYGDQEIFTLAESCALFDVANIGRSPARMDFAKLNHLNGVYIREQTDHQTLLELAQPFIEKNLGRAVSGEEQKRIIAGMPGLKERAKTIVELALGARVYLDCCFSLDDKATVWLAEQKAQSSSIDSVITSLIAALESTPDYTDAIEINLRAHAEKCGLKFGPFSQILRVALTGSTISPSLFDIIQILGHDITLLRLKTFLNHLQTPAHV